VNVMQYNENLELR